MWQFTKEQKIQAINLFYFFFVTQQPRSQNPEENSEHKIF